MRRKRIKTVVATAVAVLCSGAGAAWAQEAQVITITSQKRKEDIRKVPLSVSALGGDAMEENHVVNFADLSQSVPNLSFNSQAGQGLSTLQIRGVSSQAGTATVSVYLDEVSLTTRNIYSQGTAEPRFFDVERVEVLRGPQGTLYGASSLGGTIRFISKQPDATRFEGGTLAEVSSTDHGGTNYNLQGVINVPLAKDTLALRVGVQSGRDSGTIDRVDVNTLQVVEKGINSSHWDVARVGLRAQLGPRWTLTPSLFYQRYKSDDIDAAYETVGDYQSANAGVPLQKFQTSKIVREPGTDTIAVPSLTLVGDVGIGELTGVLAGYKRRFERRQDGTSINSPYIGEVTTDPALGVIVGFLPSAVDLDNKIRQTSVEVRLASKEYVAGGTPFTWLAGFYAAKTKFEVFDNEPVFGINAAFAAAGQDIEDPADLADTFPGAFLGDSSYYSARHYHDRQHSVFGDMTYHAGPTLRFSAGLRVLRASQHFEREGDRYYAGGPSSVAIDSDWRATTPRFSAVWDVTPQSSVFANVAKGFRLGSANRPVPATPLVLEDLNSLGLPPEVPASFKPDSLWSYEAGLKSALPGGTTFSVTAFYIRWSDIQQTIVLPESGFDFETNVGKATSYGLEFETRIKASQALTLTAQAGLQRATFAEDVPALGDLDVKKGDRIQGVPNYNVGLGFDYRFDAGFGGAFVRGNAKWVGGSRGTLVKDSADYNRPGYTTADMSVGATVGGWELAAFVKNLTNNDKVIQRPDIQGVPTVYHLRPRTIGVTGRYDF
jgi:iron complex outermembrane receptor protein